MVLAQSTLSDEPFGWVSENWPWVVLITAGLFIVWRFTRPLLHRVVMGLLETQRRALDDSVPDEEVAKRAATIEELLSSVARAAVLLTIAFIVLGVFNLWPALASLGLVTAALTLAGQSIVLDYLMGMLILLEGQYYKGDTISVAGVDGVVEEVGLRRTVLRDDSGTVHSVSNGLIRTASNLTRVHAKAIVDLPGIAEEHVEATIAAMDRVGAELAADPAWKDRVLEAPRYVSTVAFTAQGVTLRMAGRVRANDRWAVPAELRRRLVPALRAIELDAQRAQDQDRHQDPTARTGRGGVPHPD